MPSEDTWRRCIKCAVLFYSGTTRGLCPATNKGHEEKLGEQYTVLLADPHDALQSPWRWCQKCQVMFFFGSSVTGPSVRGTCPKGGQHDPSLSGRYGLLGTDDAWQRCSNCQAVFHVAGGGGVCPVGLNPHVRDAFPLRVGVTLNDPGPTVAPPSWNNWNGELTATVATKFQPTQLDELMSIVQLAGKKGVPVRAVGSSWSFSDVAEPDPAALLVDTTNLNSFLWHVLDRLPRQPPARALVHVEAGIKIHDLYTTLDSFGVAVPTLGGSGGQSLAGAISTGTHGGDIDLPPIADMVRAIHLVSAGGVQHWIERASSPVTTAHLMLQAIPTLVHTNIHYDDNLFDAVLTSMGSMGIIYAVILQARAPYDLEETIVQMNFADARASLANGSAFLRMQPDLTPFLDDAGNPERVRFLQMVVPPNSPSSGGDRPCFVTTRQEVQPSPNLPDAPPSTDVLTVLCGLNWGLIIIGVIPVVTAAIMTAATAAAALAGPLAPFILAAAGLACATAAGTLGALAATGPSFEQAVAGLANILDTLGMSSLMRDLNSSVLSLNLSAGVKQDKSYRIMDTFNYAQPDCYLVDSLELFLDVNAPNFLSTIDSILSIIDANGNVFGYLSLRFTGATQSLLGMQQATLNCSAELSILKGVADNDTVLKAVQNLVITSGGRLHWGQRNEQLTPGVLAGMLYPSLANWSAARATLLGGATTFDNVFTRRLGL